MVSMSAKTGNGGKRNRITRRDFIKKSALSAVGLGAAAVGMGNAVKGAGAGAKAGQKLDDFAVSNSLFFSTVPYGSDGGLAFSAVKYLYVKCGNAEVSPLAFDPASISPELTPVEKWVKSPGDDIFMPDFSKPGYSSPISWDMDPVSGFTPERISEFRSSYSALVIPQPFNPLGTSTTFDELAGVYMTMYAAGFIGTEIPQTVITAQNPAPMPSRFAGEEFAGLDSRTTKVEFTVPASPFQEYALKAVAAQYMKQIISNQLKGKGYPQQLADLAAGAFMLQNSPYLVKPVGIDPTYKLPVVAPADPVDSYKLRGWFIRGDGITDESGTVRKPLIIYSHGWSKSTTGMDDVCKNYRKHIHDLVMLGYSVLFYDQEGHGVSEGWNRWHVFSQGASKGVQLYAPGGDAAHPMAWKPVPGAAIPTGADTGQAVDIFLMIDQLAGMGLIDDAKGTPIILYGSSQGAIISAKAMQLRFAPPPGADPEKYSGYDFRGDIDSDCMGGSMKFVTDAAGAPPAFSMMVEGFSRDIFDSIMFLDGDVHESIRHWPGFLGLKGIYDYMSPDGVVAAFNRARGFKDIVMVRGWHSMGLLFEPNFSYTMKKMADFCKKVTLDEPPTDNSATTSVRNELCKAPDFDPSTLGESLTMGKLFGAGNSLQKLVENAMKLHPL